MFGGNFQVWRKSFRTIAIRGRCTLAEGFSGVHSSESKIESGGCAGRWFSRGVCGSRMEFMVYNANYQSLSRVSPLGFESRVKTIWDWSKRHWMPDHQ